MNVFKGSENNPSKNLEEQEKFFWAKLDLVIYDVKTYNFCTSP